VFANQAQMEVEMKNIVTFAILGLAAAANSCTSSEGKDKDGEMEYNPLTAEEEQVIIHKGTERQGAGKYIGHKEKGTYVCKRCDAPLYRSDHKFESQCGWPSFDDEIPGAVKRQRQPGSLYPEIVCNRCGGHLGHVFTGEEFTEKNVRHCVNSISLDFVAADGNEKKSPTRETADKEEPPTKTEKAYFAAGCFWGVEHNFDSTDGVISAKSGYMGGHTDDPTYQQVCGGGTGHAEAVEVTFDPDKVSYEQLAKQFFEMHNAAQKPAGEGYQYRSAVFTTGDAQKETVAKLAKILADKGVKVHTEVGEAGTFWPAEEYHQNYYKKQGQEPTCHVFTELFDK